MTQPIGIKAIASVLPEGRQDTVERAKHFGFKEDFIRNKTGFTTQTQATGDTRTSDLAQGAVAALLDKTGVNAGDIDCLIVCTQNPDGTGLPNTASTLHGEMGLAQNCAAFDISLGCSGYVYGLSVIQAFMTANGFSCGVLVTADPYTKIINPEDKDTSLLFGDGATATLLAPGAPWQLGKSVFGSDGTRRAAISTDDTGSLTMNGRGVFVFTAQTVPPSIQDAVAKNDTTLADIDLVLVHQGSRYIVEELRKRLEVGADCLPFAAADTGNTVSSSIPFMLEAAIDKPENNSILLAGFGVGLSWAVTVLTRHSA